MIEVSEALRALGANRVVWIDDHFDTKPAGLVKMFLSNLEAIKKCASPAFLSILEAYEYSEDEAEVGQYIADMPPADRKELQEKFFSQENIEEKMATQELSSDIVLKACEFLGVSNEDRWTFSDADAKLKDVCEKGDSAVGYVIDLNNASGGKFDGVTLLETLKKYGSKGTAFILTHAADASGEADLEERLRGSLSQETKIPEVPLCVISKERLSDAQGDEAVQNALRIAIKRAGLRRSVHEVLSEVGSSLASAYDAAAEMLLAIPPEQLDKFVMERGFKEGVSELHVVERAITAKLGERLRDLFASNQYIRQSTSRIRSLRSVALGPMDGIKLHRNLEEFRRLEIWEGPQLINESFTPLSPGDVFEIDPSAYPSGKKISLMRYLLLGQPCDIAMRERGNRYDEAAILVPLVTVKATSEKQKKVDIKEPLLHFKIDGEQWACDFRSVTSVRLDILDLASFRTDGCVTFDAGQQAQTLMLSGLQAAFERITAPMRVALSAVAANRAFGEEQIKSNGAFRLTFKSAKALSHIHHAKFAPSEKKARADGAQPLPARLTWSLRRVGRIKTPYAGSLLKNYLAVIGRDAFDVDFTQVNEPQDPPKKSVADQPEAAAAVLTGQASAQEAT